MLPYQRLGGEALCYRNLQRYRRSQLANNLFVMATIHHAYHALCFNKTRLKVGDCLMSSSFPPASVTHSSQIGVCKRVSILVELMIRSQAPSLRLLGRSVFRERGIVPSLPLLTLPFSEKTTKLKAK